MIIIPVSSKEKNNKISFGIKNKGYISNCNYSSALIHTFLFFHYGNRILLVSFFYFVKEYNIETEYNRPILYSSRPMRLQIFCTFWISSNTHKIDIEFSENSQRNIYDGVQFYVNL